MDRDGGTINFSYFLIVSLKVWFLLLVTVLYLYWLLSKKKIDVAVMGVMDELGDVDWREWKNYWVYNLMFVPKVLVLMIERNHWVDNCSYCYC